MVSTTKVAKQIVEAHSKYPKAYKYDLFLREFDNKVELVLLMIQHMTLPTSVVVRCCSLKNG